MAKITFEAEGCTSITVDSSEFGIGYDDEDEKMREQYFRAVTDAALEIVMAERNHQRGIGQ